MERKRTVIGSGLSPRRGGFVTRNPKAMMAAAAAVVAGLQSQVRATAYYWDGANAGVAPAAGWNLAGNWNSNSSGSGGASAIPGSADTAIFSATPVTGGITVNLDANQSVAGLQFGGSQYAGGVGGIGIASGPGTNTLTIGSGGIVQGAFTGAADNIAPNVLLSADQTWSNSTANFTVSGNVTGAPNNLSFGATNANANFSLNGVVTVNNLTVNNGGNLTLGNTGAVSQNAYNSLTVNGTLNSTAAGIAAADSAHGITFNNATFGASNAITTAKSVAFTGGTNFYTNGNLITLNGATTGGTFTVNPSGGTTGGVSLGGGANNTGLSIANNGGTSYLAKTSSSSVHAIEGSLTLNNAAVVQITGAGGDQIKDSASVTLNNTSKLDLNGASEAFDTLAGAGAVTNTLAASTSVLTLGANGGSSTVTGGIQDGAGKVSLGKSGSGTVTLSGTNTYSGATNITGGTVTVANSSTLGNGSSAVSLSGGGKLSFNNTTQLAINSATAVASTNTNIANLAFDGNFGTRWESVQGVEGQWIYADLGGTKNISSVKITWETASAKDFQIQTGTSTASNPNESGAGNTAANGWTTIDDVKGQAAVNGSATFTYNVSGSGRYIAMYGTARTTGYGYSIFEMQAFSAGGAATQNVGSLASTDAATSVSVDTNLTLATGNDGSSTSYAGAIAGNGGLSKVGTGTQTLTGTNTYTGATTVANGALSLTGSGSLAAGSAVTVGNTTTGSLSPTLSGTGTVNGTVSLLGSGTGVSAGQLTPGSPIAIGTLTTGAMTFANGSVLNELLGAGNGSTTVTAGSTASLTAVSGALTLPASTGQIALNLSELGGGSLQNGTYKLFTYTGGLANASAGNVTGKFLFTAPSGKTISLTDTTTTGTGEIDLTVQNAATHSASAVFATGSGAPGAYTTKFVGTSNPGATPNSSIITVGSPVAGSVSPGYLNAVTSNPGAGAGPKQYVQINGFQNSDQEIVALGITVTDLTGTHEITQGELDHLILDLNAADPNSIVAKRFSQLDAGTQSVLSAGESANGRPSLDLAFVLAGGLNPGSPQVFGVDFSNEVGAGNPDGITAISVTDLAVVPEPGSLGVLALGGMGVLPRWRRRRKNSR